MIRLALRNPHLVVVLALVTVVLGAVALGRIPTDLLPQFKTPAIQILTLYPGMPAEVMERDIMSRLERWTGQANGIAHQEAKAMQGVCIVKDFFHEEIDPNTALSQVTSLAMSDLYYLPPGTVPPMVMPFDPTAALPLCLISVSSETLTEKQLYDIAYFDMRNQLQAIPGVIAPAVYGGVLRRILVHVDPAKLEARGLSPMDVVRATQRSNVLIPTGSARFGEMEYLIVSNAMVPKVKDLDDIPIAVRDGRPVFIRDIGRAEDTHEIQTNIVRVNGRRQVYIPIYRQPGANTIAIVDSVRDRAATILQRVRAFFPEATDLRLDVVMDQSQRVRESIGELEVSGGLGAIFVVAVILLFLASARSTAIVLVALPLSLLAALFGLFLTGDTLNAMTLGGFSLVVGILMEQAIVVLENVARHRALGKNGFEAALDGAKEVALPVFLSTLTSVVVFFPVIFLRGMARFLFTPLALAVTFALAASYLVALTLVPAACARFLRPPRTRDGLFDRVAAAYARIVKASLRWRFAIAAGAALVVVLAFAGGSTLGRELFPTTDAGQFMVLVRAPSGTRLEETERRMRGVEQALAEVVGKPDPDGTDPSSDTRILITNIGVFLDWPAAYTPNSGPMDSFVLVQLKDERRRSAPEYAAELRRELARRFPDLEFAIDTGGMLTAALNQGLPSPIDVQVEGSKLEVLDEIAQAIARECRGVEGAVDVRVAQRIDFPAIEVEVDRTKAAYLGVSPEDVVQNIVTATNSSVSFAKSFWIDPKNGNHYFIGTQYPEAAIESLQTIEDIPVTGPDAEGPVSVRNLAKFSRRTLPAVINHRNITRVFDVYVNVEGKDVGSVASAVERRIEVAPSIRALREKYEKQGYRITVRGEYQSLRESFAQFARGFGIAAVLVYLVMVAQFRSFLDPLIVFLAVPLGLVGVIAALLATGTALSIPAFMGVIMTIGLVVDYTIILVDFTNNLRRQGLDAAAAVTEAARLRLRPILMVSLASATATLPLAIGESANAPLARAVLGGVIAAPLFTLFVIPSFYLILAGRRRVAPQEEIPA
jgi:multidrug efflux pump subunit AcrB